MAYPEDREHKNHETSDTPRHRTPVANTVAWKCLNQDKTTRIPQHLSCKLLWVPSEIPGHFSGALFVCYNPCGRKLKSIVTTVLIPQETLDQEEGILSGQSLRSHLDDSDEQA